MLLSAALALASSWGLFVGGCKFLKHQLCKGTFHEIDPVVSTNKPADNAKVAANNVLTTGSIS